MWQGRGVERRERNANWNWKLGKLCWSGVGYMALGGIMLAFGINVSQFLAPVLPLPLHLLPLVFVFVWGILHECDLKIKQRVFSSLSLFLF